MKGTLIWAFAGAAAGVAAVFGGNEVVDGITSLYGTVSEDFKSTPVYMQVYMGVTGLLVGAYMAVRSVGVVKDIVNDLGVVNVAVAGVTAVGSAYAVNQLV